MKLFIILNIIASCLIGLLFLLWKYADKHKGENLNSVLNFINKLGDNIFAKPEKLPYKSAKKETPEDNSIPFEPIEGSSPKICADLFRHLSMKGLSPAEVNRFVKDAFNILRNGGSFTLAYMNYELENLGWHESILDEKGFKMVMSLIVTEFDYTVNTRVNE